MVRSWDELHRLRNHFLSEDASGRTQDYWTSDTQLEDYDQTFAQRIRWKWQAVLRHERPTLEKRIGSLAILDWGCGTGIALRTLLEEIPETRKNPLFISDRSKRSEAFTRRKLEAQGLRPSTTMPTHPFLLLVSHVVNELRPEDEPVFLDLVKRADTVCWVEPGTSLASGRLVEWRENVLSQTKKLPLGPCPHSGACGLRTAENARHWCHFFAEVPPQISQDPFWAKFRLEMNIDLRSLPVSYLILGEGKDSAAETRILGVPRMYKGYAQALICSPSGVREEKILKRASASLWKRLKRLPFASSLEDLRGDGT